MPSGQRGVGRAGGAALPLPPPRPSLRAGSATSSLTAGSATLGSGPAASVWLGGRAWRAASLTLRYGSRSLRERLVRERGQEHESSRESHD